MLLLIAAELSAPPSSPSVFRDVTLYSKVFYRYDVVAECEKEMRDFYASWFRNFGLFDFVDQLVYIGEIRPDVSITSIKPHGRLTAFELSGVLHHLRPDT